MPRRRRPPGVYRLPARAEDRARHQRADAPAPDDHRLDAAAAPGRVQRLPGEKPARENLAAHRGGQDQARDLQNLPARAGERSPPADGKLPAHRQDRSYRLAASAFNQETNPATSGRPAAPLDTIAK